MSLPRVVIRASPGEAPVVLIDGQELPGVQSAQVMAAGDGVPRVALVLTTSGLDVELPAGVSVVRSGPSASTFVQTLSPARLEQDYLSRLDVDVTTGELFVAVLTDHAAEFDAQR